MRPRKDSVIFTLKERVILHLNEQRNEKIQDVPHSTTQEGVALALGIRRGNAARALNALVKEGLLSTGRARPYGRKAISRFYSVSSAGLRLSRQLEERANEVEVVIDTGECERVLKLSEIPAYVPGGCTLTDATRSIHNGRMELSRFEEERVRAGRSGFFGKSIPSIQDFYGRDREISDIITWTHDKKSRVIFITGVAGIGKTSLLARATKDWLLKMNVYWFSLKPWSSSDYLLGDIARFLAILGRKKVESAIANGVRDIGSVAPLLAADLSALKLVIVLDDIHDASPDLIVVVRMVIDVARRSPNVRFAIAGRRKMRLYDQGWMLSGEVWEKSLRGLDTNAAIKILSSRKISSEKLLKVCGGHPLFLKMATDAEDFTGKSLADYIRSEVLGGLTKEESEILNGVSISREPVSVSALVNHMGFSAEAIESLEAKGIIDRPTATSVYAHDIVLGDVRRRMVKRDRDALHLIFGKYYSQCVGVESQAEAIYHLSEGGDVDGACALMVKHVDELVDRGIVRDLSTLSDRLSATTDVNVLSAMGKVYRHLGRWDDALKVLHIAAARAREEKLAKMECEALLLMGGIYLRKNMVDRAKLALDGGLRIARKSSFSEEEARALYEMGALFEESSPEKSHGLFTSCKDAAARCGSSKYLAMAFYGLGRLDDRLGHIVNGRRLKEKALKLLESSGDRVTKSKLLVSLGKSAFEMAEGDVAARYYEEAVSLAREAGDVRTEAYALSNLGGVLIEKSNLGAAEDCLKKALMIFESLGEQKMIASVHGTLALAFLKHDDAVKALEHAQLHLEIVTKIGAATRLPKAHATLGLVLKAAGQMTAAEKHMKHALQLAQKDERNDIVKEMKKELKDFTLAS